MIRVLHFSDVHLEDGFEGVRPAAFMNKRLVGLLNLRLNRGSYFKHAEQKVKSLVEFMSEQSVDFVLGTGDYTSLGTEPELAYARQTIEGLTKAPLGFLAVPGNHDLYLNEEGQSGFDKYFGDVLGTDLPELSVDGVWPQVRLVGDSLAVVGINSARPNPQITRSSGKIDPAELEALDRIFKHEALDGRFVMVGTHYAPRLKNGKPDRPLHGLENAEALLDICRQRPSGLIAHGHVHWNYHVREPGLAMVLMGAGSATHSGREGIWMYEVEGPTSVRATPGRWTGDGYELLPDESIDLCA